MIVIKKNGQIVRADGKDLREVVSLQRADFPEEGNVNIIYIATNENKVYRWDETEEDYIPVGSNGETYTAGNGIVITDNEISIDGEVVAKKEDLEDYRTSSEQDVIDAGKENTSNKISSLDDATDNVKYLGAKVVKDELQNVREVAEGKCQSLVISYEDTDTIADIKEAIGQQFITLVSVYLHAGSVSAEPKLITNDVRDGLYDDLVNFNRAFNSNAEEIKGVVGKRFLLIKHNFTLPRYDIYLVDNLDLIEPDKRSCFKQGDVIYIKETDVPDRWLNAGQETVLSGVSFFALETTKVDLTNYYNKGEVNDLLDDKADVGDNYTKQETDDLLDDKANSSDVYSKTDADDLFATKTELGNKQDKSTVRTITTATFNGGLNSNELTEFTQPMTSLTIASLTVATGDNVPVWKVQFVAGSGFSFTSIPTIVWKYGTPTSWEVNKEYHLVIKKSLEANTYIVEREEVDLLVPITWSALKTLRDNKELVPGQKYRITDYECTTTQFDTMSGEHQFDIIVEADSESVLNENAHACLHSGDDYFANSNLGAWELKYCLDNDTSRFAWADTENGKGVIFWMKDEWNNECPYDFKNIQFKRYKVTDYDETLEEILDNWDWAPTKYIAFDGFENQHINGYDEDDFIWAYTFTTNKYDDASAIVDASLNAKANEVEVDAYYVQYCHDNIIKACYHTQTIDEDEIRSVQILNNIAILETDENPEESGSREPVKMYGNTFDTECSNTTIAGHAWGNKFGVDCYQNLFFKMDYNTFGNNCSYNTFGNNCSHNTFGNNCSSNTFSNYCSSNTFSNYCYSNTFSNYCYSNTFGNDCSHNTFGNNCSYNTFGNDCSSNTFGNDCSHNTFGNNCSHNTFGNNCSHNTLLDNASHTETDEYARWNIFENGVSYIDLIADESGDYNNQLQNITIRQGVRGTENNHKVIEETRGLTHDVTYRAADAEDKTI